MEIVFHIGAICTDDGQLLKSLLRNTERLAEQGVAIPGPSRYRDLLGEVMARYRGAPISPDSQEALLEAILDGNDPSRLIFSSDLFLSAPSRSYYGGQLYPRAFKASWLRNLFTEHDVSFFLAIRNPASFLPALWNRSGREQSFASFLDGGDPLAIRWSEMIMRLREAVPDSHITVWCNEDSPLVWGELLREVSGIDPLTNIHGGFDMLRTIMSNEGMKRLRTYTKANPPANEIVRRRIAAAFLDKFALIEEIEEELDVPGWTEELVEEMTALYDDDLLAIREISNVTILTP